MVAMMLIVVAVFAGTGFLLGVMAAEAALRRRERRLARLRVPRAPRAGPGP